MENPVGLLHQRLSDAIEAALGDEFAGADPVLRRSQQPQFGDFQANAAMALAKRVGKPPRDVAQQIVAAAELDDVCSSVDIAGPGFINLTLRDDVLGNAVSGLVRDERLGVQAVADSERVVIDYSSPNLAKEMHVGHLRSTIIGDAIARVLETLGHEVIRQNHYGEWGTQFGELIEHLLEQGISEDELSIADLNELYETAAARFRDDEEFRDRSRQRVVALQSGDPETLVMWRTFVDVSVAHATDVYELLGATLTPEDARPESSFNDVLTDVAEELRQDNIARIDEGALCAFPEGFTRRDGAPMALMVRRSWGGFGYEATDLAAIRYRAQELKADRIIYVVDARQAQHLNMVFEVAREAGWLPDAVRVQHVAFGTVLGPDGKPFKTRAGGTVKLNDLLKEAVERAAAVVAEKNPDLDEDTRAEVARQVGIGAVKYSDLANDRVKDYVFDWDRMLAFEGNTGPYLQYAQARIQSIFRRGEADWDAAGAAPVVVGEPQERALALELLGFGEAVEATAESLQPHRLCGYLFDLAQSFTAFYEACPVLRAEGEGQRASRLALCRAVGSTLRRGLDLLGIEAPDRM